MLSVSILLLAIAAVLLCSIVHKHFLHPLSNFRGPFWAAQTDLWRAYHLCTKRLPDTLETLHTKYGPVVRIGPNDLSFKSVAAIPQIYKSGRKVVKSSFYDGFTTFHPNLFGTRDEDVSWPTASCPSLRLANRRTASSTPYADDRWPTAFLKRHLCRWNMSLTVILRSYWW